MEHLFKGGSRVGVVQLQAHLAFLAATVKLHAGKHTYTHLVNKVGTPLSNPVLECYILGCFEDGSCTLRQLWDSG